MKATTSAPALDAVNAADTEAVGRKAALLGELRSAGFPVPAGYVIPADVLDRIEPVGDVPGDVLALVAEIAAAINGPVAVRSSAAAEDLPDASYAGQYESVLNVEPTVDAIVAAVRTCLASATSDRVASYQRSAAGEARMSVLVQQMVAAESAGVAFTANPVTGDRGEVVVNSVRGLGERLVSGNVTGDEWSVRGDTARLVFGSARSIDERTALRVAEVARQVEGYFGTPQDVEWAVENGTVWVVQARPITALPEQQEDIPQGEWERSTYTPEPVSAIFRSMMLPGIAELTSNLFPYSLGERIEFHVIGGWLYSRFVRATEPERIRAKLAGALDAVRRNEPMEIFRQWFDVVEPALTERFIRLRDDVDLGTLSDPDLLDHLDEVLDEWRTSVRTHFRIGGSGTFILGELGIACRDLLGWDAPQTFRLLVGLQGKTIEPAHRLAGLVAMARDNPALAEAIGETGHAEADTIVQRLTAIDAEFGTALADYLREYGHRTLGMDITEPTIAERPILVVNLINGQLRNGFDPETDAAALRAERESALEEARQKLADAPEDWRRIERIVIDAQYMHPGRDDSHYLTQVGAGLLRRAVLEIGTRLAERASIADPDDVFLLEAEEVRAALLAGEDRTALVETRRAELGKARANPGPRTYGHQQEGGDPSAWLAKLPVPARHVVEAGLWAWREVSGERADHIGGSDEFVLTGIAGSRGRYTGVVRVITTEAEFDKLKPGDVLVCPETTPQWSMLFPSIGALITDQGGLLSHPAIIAREYRVPAVLATGTATSRLRDGQVVTVDGTQGTVELVEERTAI